jgi:serine phosphatase RsbU (regulator of sigma subunit)
MRFIIFLILILVTSLSSAQSLYPALSKQIGKGDSLYILNQIESIYKTNVRAAKYDPGLLKLWKLTVLDSLEFKEQAKNLATSLENDISSIKHSSKSIIYKRLGDASVDKNNFEKAIDYYHKGLQIAESYSDKKRFANFQKLIGTTYLKLDQHKTAEGYLRSSLENSKAIQDTLGMANAAISLGNALKEQDKLDESLVYYEMSLNFAKKIGNQRLIAGNYNNLGNVERRKGDKQKALKYFFLALEMNIKSKNELWQSFNYHNIANTLVDQKKYNQAIDYFIKSNDIKEKINDSLSLLTGYKALSDAYASINDYPKAYNYLLKYTNLNEKLNLTQQAIELKGLEAKFETEKKEAEIKHLKTSKELQELKNESLEQKNERSKYILILVLLVVLVAILGIFVLWRSNAARKKTNALLHIKNREVEEANTNLTEVLEELSDKNAEILDSIQYATYIQKASLPDLSSVSNSHIQFACFYQPKDLVSGDFYFFHQLNNYLIFGVADCTGHGVPGGMVSLIGMNAIDKVISEDESLNAEQTVSRINEVMKLSLEQGNATLNDGMDLSFCKFDIAEKRIQFVGANHNFYLLRSKDTFDSNGIDKDLKQLSDNEQIELLSLDGIRRPIGKSYVTVPFSSKEIQLIKGDRVILFSDGYADQLGGVKDKKLKKSQLLNFILQSAHLSLTDQNEYLKKKFFDWKGDQSQVDDVCLLLIEIC